MRLTPRRRITLAVCVTALVAGAIALPLSGMAFATNGSQISHGPDLSLTASYVAGGANTAESGDLLTFVFTAKNLGPGSAGVSIGLSNLQGVDRESATTRLMCVLPTGSVINPDGDFCEPGFAKSGKSGGSLVFTGEVTGTGDVVVRACVTDLSGTVDPKHGNDCRTLRVNVV